MLIPDVINYRSVVRKKKCVSFSWNSFRDFDRPSFAHENVSILPRKTEVKTAIIFHEHNILCENAVKLWTHSVRLSGNIERVILGAKSVRDVRDLFLSVFGIRPLFQLDFTLSFKNVFR
jgi:hypothetical protein